jgi:hypothetical protein
LIKEKTVQQFFLQKFILTGQRGIIGQMLFLNYPKMFAIVRYCVRFANVNNLCHCLFWANVQDVHIHQLLNRLLFSRQLLPKRNTFAIDKACQKIRTSLHSIIGLAGKQSDINPAVNMKLYKIVVLPSVLYGC